MDHVIQSEIGMLVYQILALFDTDEGFKARIRCCFLMPDDDTVEPLYQIFEDLLKLLQAFAKEKHSMRSSKTCSPNTSNVK